MTTLLLNCLSLVNILLDIIALRYHKKGYMIIALVYHTEHFLTGFMVDPRGHCQSRANSGMLDNVPLTLIMSGLWTPDMSLTRSAASRYLAHQTLAPLNQNS